MTNGYPQLTRVGQLIIQTYERYLPSAFDESMSILQKLNRVEELVNQTGALVNSAVDLIESAIIAQDLDIVALQEEVLNFETSTNQDIVDFKLHVTEQLVPSSLESILTSWLASGKLADILSTRVLSMKVDKTYFDTVIASLGTGGTKGLFYSIVALTTAYPTGTTGTYLVLDASFAGQAHSFIWDGSVWKDLGVYQAIEIATNGVLTKHLNKGSVTPEKTSFVTEGVNKFNKNSSSNSLGSFLASTSVKTTQSDTAHTHPITVKSGDVVNFTHFQLYGITGTNTAFKGYLYDKNDQPLYNIGLASASFPNTGLTVNGNVDTFTVPDNANIAYMKLNYLVSGKDTVMVSVNEAYPLVYTSYTLSMGDLGLNKDITSIKTGAGINDKAITFNHLEFATQKANKFNKDSLLNTESAFLSITGTHTAQANTAYTHKIFVKPNDVLRITQLAIYGPTSTQAYFDGMVYDDKGVILYTLGYQPPPSTLSTIVPVIENGVATFTFPNDNRVSYVKINYVPSTKGTFMATINEAYPLSYVGYGATLKNISLDETTVVVEDIDFLKHLLINTLCIGDSLTDGGYYGTGYAGATIEENYPYYLGKMTGWNTTNAGVNGITPQNWFAVEAPKYNFADYDSFVICLGTNGGFTDTLTEDTSTTPYASTATGSLCKIIELIKAENPKAIIYLTNIFATSGASVATSNLVIGKVATKYTLPVIDISSTFGDPVMHPFGNVVHFGKVGNLHLAKNVLKGIEKDMNTNKGKYEVILLP